MIIRFHKLIRFTALAAALTLAACGGGSEDEGDLANLDNQIVGNDADPALTSALQDQILVDPNLANQSNRNAVRPPETPTQAQYPATQGGSAAPARPMSGSQQSRLAGTFTGGPECQDPDSFDYNPSWANRLPAAFAVPRGARITDAAGNDKGACRSRVVTFNIAAAPQRLIDWYSAAAARAGYSAESQSRDGDLILAGTSNAGGAYFLIVTPAGSGADVALIVNNGR
ncbi:hypothetical protein [Sphingosinicella rhizophila]|uniref:Lipoprotein n=1 Tax=Sphingosinicella rhizophila TaxID=3050082 RepID=A0ABU3Q8D2_9SPHN|nr:hypothetical protein [Sphingosinicella sp. GR2756]MDT9599233.1 hypothetical protein [Sphingosinicella sp. GR2756]